MREYGPTQGFEHDVMVVMLAWVNRQDVTFVGPTEEYTNRVLAEAERRLGLSDIDGGGDA